MAARLKVAVCVAGKGDGGAILTTGLSSDTGQIWGRGRGNGVAAHLMHLTGRGNFALT